LDWITKELTGIDKVRRNVMLLSALACLVAFFPVRSEEISLLGAKFASDVVAFALFHALMFYTATLAVRTFIFRQLTKHSIEDFSEEIEERIAASAQTEKTYWKTRIDDAAHEVRKQEAEIGDLDQQIVEAQSELAKAEKAARSSRRIGTAETARLAADVTLCSDQVEALKFERGRAEGGLQNLRVMAARVADSARSAANYRATRLSARGPTARGLAVYVILGEYVLPIVFGIASAALLRESQTFPLLWDVPLLREFIAQISET
jgi:hypothetical protein